MNSGSDQPKSDARRPCSNEDTSGSGSPQVCRLMIQLSENNQFVGVRHSVQPAPVRSRLGSVEVRLRLRPVPGSPRLRLRREHPDLALAAHTPAGRNTPGIFRKLNRETALPSDVPKQCIHFPTNQMSINRCIFIEATEATGADSQLWKPGF